MKLIMAKAARARSMSRKRTVAYALGAAVLVVFVVAGLALANSNRVARVTNNAFSLHWANATTGTSALTRAGLVQAVTFSELNGTAGVEQSDLDFAMDQVYASSEDLDRLLANGNSYLSYEELQKFVDAVAVAVGELEAGDVSAAKEHITTDVESAYMDLAESLQSEQEIVQQAIVDNGRDGQTMNDWVIFILTLGVPGSAVVVYWVVTRRQMRELKERSRLELETERTISRAKDSFIAGLSHELRTPLTSIYGFAEVLTDGGVRGPEATQETARIIANEAAEMTRMVDDLLAASRLESTGIEFEMNRTNVVDVVEASITPFRRAGMDIEWEPTPAVVETDAARLKHVLVNLISNAARHGGPTVGIEVTEAGGSVDIEVWDDGPGVPKERVDRLFQRFVHDDEAPLLTGSVGLGLAVASRITGLMGGELKYQRFGTKSYFIVSIPTASTEEVETPGDEISVAAMIRSLAR